MMWSLPFTLTLFGEEEVPRMTSTTARLFDGMAEDYDTLEPWYEHLYAILHAMVLSALGGPVAQHRALDAGCGNGFQTALLERLGYKTHGIDIAPKLLAVARRRLPSANLVLGNVQTLPYCDESFDAVSCCGSTLSFVDDPDIAIREFARVLKPGARLLMDVEHRWSLDLVWMLLSPFCGDFLGYGASRREAWRSLSGRPLSGCSVNYPGYGRLRLFTRHELSVMLTGAGLRPLRWSGIHSITNLIPSTILHRDKLGRTTATLYRRLCALDARLSASPTAARAANSLVVLAEKSPPYTTPTRPATVTAP
jgi:MPBQ/MSBQ methyltransferase